MSGLTIAIDARLAAGTWTGDSSYWSGLLYGLAKVSPDAKFLLFTNLDKPAGLPESERFEWIRLRSKDRWFGLVDLPLAARRRRASVLHKQYNLSPLAGRIGVTTIHDVSFFIEPSWFLPRDRTLMKRMIPSSARRARRVLTVSETSKKEIEHYVPSARGKTVVTHLACPIHIDTDSKVDVRTEFGLDGPYLLTVGMRWPRKNMILAVRAAGLTDYSLVVTGKPGWMEDEFPPGTKLTGYVDNDTLSALYRNAALYLAPSFHEGFGLPLLEAFACGCPVMCSSGGSMPEVAAGAGVVMKSWEPEDWAASIRELLPNVARLDELRRLGGNRLKDFSWEKTAGRTFETYVQVAEENRR